MSGNNALIEEELEALRHMYGEDLLVDTPLAVGLVLKGSENESAQESFLQVMCSTGGHCMPLDCLPMPSAAVVAGVAEGHPRRVVVAAGHPHVESRSRSVP